MITIQVKRGETVLMENSGQELVNLSWQGNGYDHDAEWNGEYEEGDVIVLKCDEAPCYLNIQLDDVSIRALYICVSRYLRWLFLSVKSVFRITRKPLPATFIF